MKIVFIRSHKKFCSKSFNITGKIECKIYQNRGRS